MITTLLCCTTANSLASGSLDRVEVPPLTTGLTFEDINGNGLDHHTGSPQATPLPTGWMHIADPEGRVFYYNLLTKQSQWQCPA